MWQSQGRKQNMDKKGAWQRCRTGQRSRGARKRKGQVREGAGSAPSGVPFPAHQVWKEGICVGVFQHKQLWDVDDVFLAQSQLLLQDFSIPVNAVLETRSLERKQVPRAAVGARKGAEAVHFFG